MMAPRDKKPPPGGGLGGGSDRFRRLGHILRRRPTPKKARSISTAAPAAAVAVRLNPTQTLKEPNHEKTHRISECLLKGR